LEHHILLHLYAGSESLIEELINLGIMDVDGDFISISFLNEQWTSKETQKQVNIINGKKGGRPKKQNETENKPNGFSFANQNDNRNESHIEYNKSKVEVELKIEEDNSVFEEEKSTMINALVSHFGFEEDKYYPQKRIILQFVGVLYSNNQQAHFIEQFQNYHNYKTLSKEKLHNFSGLIGTPAMRFENSSWNSENCAQQIINFNKANKTVSSFQKTNDVFEQLRQMKKQQRNGNTEV